MSSEIKQQARKGWINTLESKLSTLFGILLIVLSCVVVVESLARKVFNFSLQGADELGGYTLAICSTLAFSVALIGRSHIRVDVAYDMLGKKPKVLINWLSILLMFIFSAFILYLSLQVLIDSSSYGSTAPTPWGTPLIIPQFFWIIGLSLFSIVSFILFFKATILLIGKKLDQLNDDYQPKSVKEDLAFELNSIQSRAVKTQELQT